MSGTKGQTGAPHPLPEYGDLILAYLEQLGVEYVFGIPGGAIEPFYNALARSERRGGPRAIVARHETGAAFMADGYARNTGKLGVCCATTGPGATNLITGVASAYENHIPMLVITAQTPLSTFGRGAIQESSCTGINTVELFHYCTRYSTLVSHVEQFEHKLITAIMTAFSPPMGPAHISVPMDIMRHRYAGTAPSVSLPRLLRRPALYDSDAVEQLYRELIAAERPVFLIGDEAREAVGSILSLAVKLDARVIVTPQGKGLVSPYHPLFRGVISFAGHREAQNLILDSGVDRIFIVGANMGEVASNGWDKRLLGHNIIHIDSNEANLAQTPMALLHVRGRIQTVIEKLLDRLEADGIQPDPAVTPAIGMGSFKRRFTLDDEEKCFFDSVPIKPQRLMTELPNIFPPNTYYLADSGASFSWAIHYLHPYDRRMSGQRDGKGGLFHVVLDFGSMGWAIGSAVGAALARPGDPVVCITGDGSMLMSGQEITVALQEKLPVIFVILNDSALGMVKHGQRMTGAELLGTDLPMVDFAAVAKAMGADAFVIRSPDDLLALDGKAIANRRGPTLLDVRIDPDEIPPIGFRIGSLTGSNKQDLGRNESLS
ncbi:MAG: thiamine pyrophosphate-binding protein [Pseudomonadales bacterium]|nr:thiamine pyrophosphate-binding protein [Pseudomonadales bacterium]